MIIPIWLSMSITVFIIILGLTMKKSPLITILLLIWEYILIAFNNGGPDIVNYYAMYKESVINENTFTFGAGHFWTMWNIFSKMVLDLDMVHSHALIMIPIMIIFYLGIRNLTPNVNFVFALMMLYPLPDMVIQRRQVIAMAFIVYALRFLKKKSITNQILFSIFVIISYGFHEMALLFFPLLIVPYLNVDGILRTMIFLDIGSFILVPVLSKYANNIFSASRVELYTTQLQISTVKTIPFVMIHFSIVLLVYYLHKLYLKSSTEKKQDDFLLKISMISTVYSALYFTNTTFFRYFRSVIPASYAYFANDSRKSSDRIQLQAIVVLAIIGLNLFFYVLFGQIKFSGLILPIFRDNILFNPLGLT